MSNDKFILSAGQAHQLEMALDREGWTAADLTAFIQNKPVIRRTQELVRCVNGEVEVFIESTHKVIVDYSMTLTEMIAAGEYDAHDEEHYSARIDDPELYQVRGVGKRELEIELLGFEGLELSRERLDEELKARGLRRAKIEEVLALGAQHPTLQFLTDIVCLGSVRGGNEFDRTSNCVFLTCNDDGSFAHKRRGLSSEWTYADGGLARNDNQPPVRLAVVKK
jgi:hypothetical protein